ncbi:MAG: glutaredoxin family protein, partial [Polyangiaceae bacterium]
FVFFLAMVVVSCHRKKDAATEDPSPSAAFVVKDSSEGFLFTWIDEKGDFHVEQKATDVPLVGRDAVRVVDPSREDGTHADRVFVADLRLASADGSYPVKSIARAEFDELAVARRKGKTATLDGVDGGATAPGGSAMAGLGGMNFPSGPNAGQGQDQGARPAVIIYGAQWCGPCHQAAAYLKKKGIPFAEKDIEADRGAQREMQAKLAKAGLRAGSIPVLDVRGKMMVGFNAQALDDALGAAL